ncbi:MAG: SRPBCC domain-containing protein [Kineosporiaceae bacterium]|nr:SRPBCC domain-containing protein [Kineosporiaceae bacterium]
MTVTVVEKNPDDLSMTITAEFTAPVDRVWQVWTDPRQLERWWGPPTYPATVVDHDLAPGGRVSYYMTSPEGEKYHGWWRVLTVEAPGSLEFEDGFSDEQGNENRELPVTTVQVRLEPQGSGTVMTIRSRYASAEAMQQLLEMGMEEGMTAALGQIDELLAA